MKLLNFKRYKKYKFFLLYVIGFIIITTTIYLIIPMFFDYEKSKDRIENKIYSEFNLKSSIRGKIKYNLFPSPQIKIKNLLIKDLVNSDKNLGEVENAVLKIPFKKLISLNKINFNRLELNDAKIKLNLNQINQYKKFFTKQFQSKDIKISDGSIVLLDGEKFLATLSKIDLKYHASSIIDETTFKGKFQNENIVINIKNKKTKNPTKIITIKLFNLKFRANIILSSPDSENYVHGKSLLTLNRNKADLKFNWKDSSIKIKSGNVKNKFLNGKIDGDINFLPFFNFNLNLDLSSLNFGSMKKKLLKMDNDPINNLFTLNNKINGNLNLNVNKIYSGSKLIKSLESRIQFINQDILIEQMLIDFGKLGAADVTGLIKNENNHSNFSFKKNLFIDNAKYFYSRFGIYNKSTEPENLYISGNFNLKNQKIRFDELVTNNKLNKEDINYYQSEFNQIVLENGYKSLFDFFKLKEFINAIASAKE